MLRMSSRALAAVAMSIAIGLGLSAADAADACPGVGVFYTVGCAMHNPPPPPCTNIGCRNDKL